VVGIRLDVCVCVCVCVCVRVCVCAVDPVLLVFAAMYLHVSFASRSKTVSDNCGGGTKSIKKTLIQHYPRRNVLPLSDGRRGYCLTDKQYRSPISLSASLHIATFQCIIHCRRCSGHFVATPHPPAPPSVLRSAFGPHSVLCLWMVADDL